MLYFLNYSFNFVQESSTTLREGGVPRPNASLTAANLKAPKNGYAYVYVSNESSEPVYFDNLQVAHTRGRIVEETHYYSYGLQIAAISSKKVADPREGTLDNRYGYNDKELWDDADLNWLDYGFRNYDPQIGRFVQLDPLANDYVFLSPYLYAYDDPITHVDVDGLFGEIAGSVLSMTAETSKTLSTAVVYAVRKVTPAVAKSGSFWKSAGRILKKTADIATDFIPVVGSIKDIYQGAKSGNGWQIAAGVGGLALDIGSLGTASLIKGGVKAGLKAAVRGGIKQEAEIGFKKVASKLTNKIPCGCFLAGTLVLTDTGYKRIELVKEGDVVWAYNDTTGVYGRKRVVNIFEYERDSVYRVGIGNEVISATSDHPFFVGGRWLRVGQLKVGDSVVTYSGSRLAIDAISIVPGRTTVHNFEVEDYHTYYVSSQQVLVHNSGPCPTKFNGKFTEPKLPGKTIAKEDGVTIEHYTKSGDHGPPHAHVKGGGAETKIGQNGKPIDGSPELSYKQRQVVENNKTQIRKVIKKIGRYNSYNNL